MFLQPEDYSMMATPFGLLALALRRCIQRGRFQFSIKDGLVLPWTFLPVTLIAAHVLTADFLKERVWEIAAFQIAGAAFCWSYASGKVGSWSRSLSLLFGASVLSTIYIVVFMAMRFFQLGVGWRYEKYTWLFLLAVNFGVVALIWFLAAIKPEPETT